MEVDSHWLTELMKVIERNSSVGAAGCEQLLMNDWKRIDDEGGYLDVFGLVYQGAIIMKSIQDNTIRLKYFRLTLLCTSLLENHQTR